MDVSGVPLKVLMSICAGRYSFGSLPLVLPLLLVDGSRATALVDKASQQILRAGEIIQRLRDFVSKGKLTRLAMDIGPVLNESVALALTNRSHRSIKVVERVDPGARFVRIDRVQIQQVLVNLIRNAA